MIEIKIKAFDEFVHFDKLASSDELPKKWITKAVNKTVTLNNTKFIIRQVCKLRSGYEYIIRADKDTDMDDFPTLSEILKDNPSIPCPLDYTIGQWK